MAGTLSPMPVFTGFDNNGNPLSGGLLYTYLAGVGTPATTWSDSALTVENSNPIVLNAGGRPTSGGGIYLDALSYKFVLKTSAGVTIWTQDDITAVSSFDVDLDILGTAGETLLANDGVYLSAGDGGRTAGRWYKTDADNDYASSTARVVGMVPAAIASGDTGSFRLQGRLTGLTGLVAGTDYFCSATAGLLTSVEPSNSRYMGRADSTTTIVLVPSLTPQTTTTTTQATSATGTQNDFALTPNTIQLVCSGLAPVFTGFATGVSGQEIEVLYTGSGSLQITHQGGGSVAADRCIAPSTIGLTIGPNGRISMIYDGTAQRWRIATVSAGTPIPVTFNAGDFTALLPLTWTVASGDVTAFWWSQVNKFVTMNLVLATTSTGGSQSNEIYVAVPGGFTPTSGVAVAGYSNMDNGSDTLVCIARLAASGTTITVSPGDAGNWSDGQTNTGALEFQLTVEVN